MRDQIREAAEQNSRSMNAEIVARLASSFEGEFVSADDMSGIRKSFQSVVDNGNQLLEQLKASAQRERELSERLSPLIDALAKSNANNEKLIALIEASNDVRQEA